MLILLFKMISFQYKNYGLTASTPQRSHFFLPVDFAKCKWDCYFINFPESQSPIFLGICGESLQIFQMVSRQNSPSFQTPQVCVGCPDSQKALRYHSTRPAHRQRVCQPMVLVLAAWNLIACENFREAHVHKMHTDTHMHHTYTHIHTYACEHTHVQTHTHVEESAQHSVYLFRSVVVPGESGAPLCLWLRYLPGSRLSLPAFAESLAEAQCTCASAS